MWNTKKSVMLSLVLTYVAIALLLISMLTLPAIVTWYVEYQGRAASLATTIMLTFYPCTPFAAFAFWQMRCLLKSVLAGEVFTEKNASCLRRLSWCAYAIMGIMLISAKSYLPFFVFAVCSGFIGLTVRTLMNFFAECVTRHKDTTDNSSENNNIEN